MMCSSAHAQADGVPQNDGSGTVWRARDGGRLTVFMIDHGYKTNGFMAFRVNETQALSAETFKTWMDDLQSANPAIDLQLVIDCCFAGAFIEPLRANPLFANRRVLLASTSAGEESMFLPPPDLTSFMFNFLSSAYMGNSFGEAWRSAGRFFRAFPVADQAPQIWDGTTPGFIDDETTTLTLADRTFFGRSWAYGVQSRKDINQFFPAFNEETPIEIIPATITPGQSFEIRANMQRFQRPLTVTLAVRPPAPDVVTGQPVTALPRVQLVKIEDQNTSHGEIWAATIDTASTASVFHSPGSYLISATARFEFNRVSNPELATVLVSEGIDPDLTPIRAVIGIGAGTDADQNATFAALGEQSHEVSLGRFRNQDGVPHEEWLEYFTPLATATGRDWPQTNKTRLLETIAGDHFAEDAQTTPVGRLYVHLVGPATFDAATPTTPALVLQGNGATTLSLTVLELRDALDDFQSRPLHHGVTAREAIVVLDMPGSGAWLGPLAAPNRIVICSARPSDSGFFVPGVERTGSFSGRFMLAAAQGSSLRESFRGAQNFFRAFTTQAPWYDDNSDGRYGNDSWLWRLSSLFGDPTAPPQDGLFARERWWGRRYAFAGDESGLVPFVLSVTPEVQTLSPGQTAGLTAQLLEGVAPVRVVARLLPPRSARTGSDAGLIEIELTTGSQTAQYEASFAAPAEPGEWSIAVVAQYADGEAPGGGVALRDSEPIHVKLVVLGGPAPDIFDLIFEDDNSGGINGVPVNYDQLHNFDGPQDADWFSFTVGASRPHSVRIDAQGRDANAVLEVYLDGLTTPTLVVNDGLEGEGEYELITLPLVATTQTAYVCVRNDVRGGLETGYRLRVSRDVGPNTGVPTVGLHTSDLDPNDGGVIPPQDGPQEPQGFAEPTPLDGGQTAQHYPNVRFTVPPGVVTVNSLGILSGIIVKDPSNMSPEFQVAVANWHSLAGRADNYTPVELNIYPIPAGQLTLPLTARMEFLNAPELNLTDGNLFSVIDLPAGTTAAQAEFWAWRSSTDQWERLVVPVMVNGNIVTADIPINTIPMSADRNEVTASMYLAIAPTAALPEIEVTIGGETAENGSGPHSLGATPRGSSPLNLAITVENTGGSALTLSGLSVGAPFLIAEGLVPALAPGASDTFTVQLPTGTAGTFTASVSFATNDANENPFTLGVQGTITAPEVAVTHNGNLVPDEEDPVHFGSVAAGGTPPAETFTVHNSGNATLLTSGLGLPDGFVVVEGLSGSIAPGSSDTFTIILQTESVGLYEGSVGFATNDADENPYGFNISGEVVEAPEPEIDVRLGVTPVPNGYATVDFGTVAPASTPPTRTFTVNNDGDGALIIGALDVPNGYSVIDGLGAQINGQSSDQFTVAMNTANSGEFTGLISLTTNDADENPYTIGIKGRVLDSASLVWIDFTFGGAEWGSQSNPFNTLIEGVDAVQSGGTLRIKAGSTGATHRITKRMFLKSNGGSAIIGRGPLPGEPGGPALSGLNPNRNAAGDWLLYE